MATALIPTNDPNLGLTREMSLCYHENHDNCSVCSRPFVGYENTYLGIYSNDQLVYTCDTCSNNMKELYSILNHNPRPYVVPDKNSALWRHMDFAKYVTILSTKSLFFNSADGFEDKFEGALSELNSVSVWRDMYAASRRYDYSIYQPQLQGEELEQHIKGDVWFLEDGFKRFRRLSCVNCWHENEGESVAMWDLYSKDYANAVAIKTTYQKLYEALGKDVSMDIGRVNYIDYRTSFPSINYLFFYKRKSFKHENEVRAVIQDISIDLDADESTKGLSIPVDVRLLIERIYISPKAPDRLIKLIESVNEAFGFGGIPVEKSEIGQIPC